MTDETDERNDSAAQPGVSYVVDVGPPVRHEEWSVGTLVALEEDPQAAEDWRRYWERVRSGTGVP